jgi:hypothetical protein
MFFSLLREAERTKTPGVCTRFGSGGKEFSAVLGVRGLLFFCALFFFAFSFIAA